ncbi:MAG: DUF2007 domain-containing protein [Methylococcales bacterium]
MQRIYDAQDVIEGNILKGLLEQCGVAANITGYYLQGGIGELPVSGTVSIWVENEDVEQAQSIVDEYRK